MNDTVFLIHSGDKSCNIWDYWYYYWKKYWTCHDFIDTIFLTENKSEIYEGVRFFHTGDVPWSDGLINFLSSVGYKYVIYQHEDYFLTEETNAKVAKDLIEVCKENDLKLLKCCGLWSGCPEWNKDGAFTKTDLYHDIYRYNNENSYLISHQTAIWEKDFLLSTLKRNDTPWCHELAGTARLRERNIPIHAYRSKCPFDYCETMVHGNVRDGQKKYFEINLEEK